MSSKVALNAKVSQAVHDAIIREADSRNMTYTTFLDYLGKAFMAGSVFIIEQPTFDLLMEGVMKQVHRTAARVARQEANMVLVERGFISNPHR